MIIKFSSCNARYNYLDISLNKCGYSRLDTKLYKIVNFGALHIHLKQACKLERKERERERRGGMYEGWHVMTSRHANIIKTYEPINACVSVQRGEGGGGRKPPPPVNSRVYARRTRVGDDTSTLWCRNSSAISPIVISVLAPLFSFIPRRSLVTRAACARHAWFVSSERKSLINGL